MEVKTTYEYDLGKSIERIKNMLNTSGEFEPTDDIQKRKDLTYENGYYLNCYALFVDIRDSSKLPEVHQKKVLAKLYRSYISELTAIMQSFKNCKEVNIVGDCVNGIFTYSTKDDVMQPFQAAYTINGLVQILNRLSSKKNYSPLKIGIGIAKGDALMIQAGYENSGLNDVIWMGNVVNYASHLCGSANKDGNKLINILQEVYDDLKGKTGTDNVPYQEMFCKPDGKEYYTGNVILTLMSDWLAENK